MKISNTTGFFFSNDSLNHKLFPHGLTVHLSTWFIAYVTQCFTKNLKLIYVKNPHGLRIRLRESYQGIVFLLYRDHESGLQKGLIRALWNEYPICIKSWITNPANFQKIRPVFTNPMNPHESSRILTNPHEFSRIFSM